jgi:hypothetical protein
MARVTIVAGLLLTAPLIFPADETTLSKDIELVARQGRGTLEGRNAWDRLTQAGPESLSPVLHAMRSADSTACNWLRTALDRIVERAQAMGKSLPTDDLLAVARDARQAGRARRWALDVVEQVNPGTSEKQFPSWLDDPEFRFEAVAVTLAQGRRLLKQGPKEDASPVLRRAFAAARDVQQARDIAAGMEQLGIKVSVGEHLGFLMNWYLIGPFDGGGQKGFHLSFPPERNVDLKEELAGQGGKKLRWVRYQVVEPPHASGARHQALVNLREKDALGDADDAVAFAYSEFTVAQGGDVEFRGAADDNFTVWVNGQKVFGFEEWRNGVRLDRHRFPAKLQAGKNRVLVKICQSAAPNPEPNWEFFLRVVDATGQGIAVKNPLP